MSDYYPSPDPLYDEARQIVIDRSHPSAAFLQRHFTIGYNRACRILEALEAAGVVSPPDHANKGRRYVVPPQQPAKDEAVACPHELWRQMPDKSVICHHCGQEVLPPGTQAYALSAKPEQG